MPNESKSRTAEMLAPDERPVTKREAAYLASQTGVSAEELVGRPVAELSHILRWRIDPISLLFRKVCGRVVRQAPISGLIQGVPNATVHVLDTDCSFVGLFPVESAWWWYWPLWCDTEEIGTTQTDECGNFCAWIPRWAIDRILQFRLERFCFPDIYRPNIRDILREIVAGPVIRPNPNPPDPSPFERLAVEHLPIVAERLGQNVANQLRRALANRSFGSSMGAVLDLLDVPAFGVGLHPPVAAAPKHLRDLIPAHVATRVAASAESKNALAERLAPRDFVGPFVRCVDVVVPEWVTVIDFPDISFRVTQDVDLDGDQEVIYSEGLFDVRWDAGDIPPVVLHASQIARPSAICEGPGVICEDVPAIRTVGLMPLEPSHHDATSGLSIKVNRPRPLGLSTSPQASPAATPYAGTLQLHGCQRIGGAVYYRILYKLESANEAAFTGVEWWAPRLGSGPPFHIQADTDGWYPILPVGDLVFPYWLFNWETEGKGHYVVRLETGDAAQDHLEYSAPIAFEVDNYAPSATFDDIRWGLSATGPFPDTNILPAVCPLITRPARADIYLRVRWSVSANHLLTASLSAGGCGGVSPVLVPPPPPLDPSYDHWHTDPLDDAVTRTAIVKILGAAQPGCYDVTITAWSRSFNPAGDGGGPGTDWLTNYFYLPSQTSRGIAVIDA
jgi:hypothetical protein